jgi:hypothetical protein
MRYLLIVLLLLAAHFSLTALVPGEKAWVGWPFAVNSQPVLAGVGSLAQPLGQVATPLLALISGVAFLTAVLSLIGWLIPAELFGPLVIIGAGSSILLYALYAGVLALLPLGLDLFLLWGILALHWTVPALKGA